MLYNLNIDKIIKSLEKLTGGISLPDGFLRDFVEKQLKFHAGELHDQILADAKAKVGKHNHIYHANITVGKPYTLEGIHTIRVYAKRPAYHANLIEHGFYNHWKEGTVEGKKIFTKAAQDYEQQFTDKIAILFSKKVEELIE